MWSIKYRPSKVEDMVGNEDARREFVEWLKDWSIGSKPLLLLGPAGVGKTTLVKAAANQFGFDLIELNASDTRTKDRLESIVKPLLSNASITSEKVLLFLDEVDGLSGSADRGGLNVILSLAKHARIPIALAANKEQSSIIKDLSKVCKVVRFKHIPPRLVELYLDHILKQEKASIDIGMKISIVRESKGDIRSVLNSAELAVLGFKAYEHVASKVEIHDAINRFFNASSIDEAIEALRSAEGFYYDQRFYYNQESRRLDKLMALFSSMINAINSIDDLAYALDRLSYADVIIGRMNKSREWRLLRYVDQLLAYSLFKFRGLNYYQYDLPFPIINRIFKSSKAMNSLLNIIASNMHVSRSKAALYHLPYLLLMMKGKGVDDLIKAGIIDDTLANALKDELSKV